MSSLRLKRVAKELQQIEADPPPGIQCWPPNEQDLSVLEAVLLGAPGTPYEGGSFKLDVRIPERYPFVPISARFATVVYHPNIDDQGRICLDTLKMPPKGSWKPSLSLATVLTSIRLLLSEANPDDGLVGDIANEYKTNRAVFDAKARRLTREHACHPRPALTPVGTNICARPPSEETKECKSRRRDGTSRLPPLTSTTISSLPLRPQEEGVGASAGPGSDDDTMPPPPVMPRKRPRLRLGAGKTTEGAGGSGAPPNTPATCEVTQAQAQAQARQAPLATHKEAHPTSVCTTTTTTTLANRDQRKTVDEPAEGPQPPPPLAPVAAAPTHRKGAGGRLSLKKKRQQPGV